MPLSRRFLVSVRKLLQYQKALEIRLRVFGHEHPDVATSYHNIGVVYDKKGDLENARVQHQKALEIRLRVFGRDHPLTKWSERLAAK